MSLIETCRRFRIDPYAYLKDVIAELAKDSSRAEALTPRGWRERELAKAEKAAEETDG